MESWVPENNRKAHLSEQLGVVAGSLGRASWLVVHPCRKRPGATADGGDVADVLNETKLRQSLAKGRPEGSAGHRRRQGHAGMLSRRSLSNRDLGVPRTYTDGPRGPGMVGPKRNQALYSGCHSGNRPGTAHIGTTHSLSIRASAYRRPAAAALAQRQSEVGRTHRQLGQRCCVGSRPTARKAHSSLWPRGDRGERILRPSWLRRLHINREPLDTI